jgi:probable HAF family extracellular repeat protein
MKSSRIVKLALFVIVVFGSVETAFADISYSFTTIDVPGASNGTQVYGINDSGQIVGYYQDSSGVHGFLDTGGSFTTINVPGYPLLLLKRGLTIHKTGCYPQLVSSTSTWVFFEGDLVGIEEN